MESTTNAFLESLAAEGAGFNSSSSASSRRGSTHSNHSSSIPESRHSLTPLLGRRNGGGVSGGSKGGKSVSSFSTSSRRAPSSSSTLSLRPSPSPSSYLTITSLSYTSASSSTTLNNNNNNDADSNYVTKSTLPPPHLRRFNGATGVARLAPADHEGFSALRRLLRTLFQTDYNDAFFRDVREAAAFSRLALVDGKPVAAIACRIQENAEGCVCSGRLLDELTLFWRS